MHLEVLYLLEETSPQTIECVERNRSFSPTTSPSDTVDVAVDSAHFSEPFFNSTQWHLLHLLAHLCDKDLSHFAAPYSGERRATARHCCRPPSPCSSMQFTSGEPSWTKTLPGLCSMTRRIRNMLPSCDEMHCLRWNAAPRRTREVQFSLNIGYSYDFQFCDAF